MDRNNLAVWQFRHRDWSPSIQPQLQSKPMKLTSYNKASKDSLSALRKGRLYFGEESGMFGDSPLSAMRASSANESACILRMSWLRWTLAAASLVRRFVY